MNKLVSKSLLYKKPIPVDLGEIYDERPQIPYDVYEYELTNARVNPFGIVTKGFCVHEESLYSAQIPIGKIQSLRLIVAAYLKPELGHNFKE